MGMEENVQRPTLNVQRSTQTVFELDHQKLATDSRFVGIAARLGKLSPIDSKASFNRYCREAIRLWDEHFCDNPAEPSLEFTELCNRVDRGGENIIQTSWGGVVITQHEHPRVEKFLVIRKGGYLALEKHEEKDEQLEVKEGAGLVLWRSGPNDPLAAEPLERGGQFHFEPGMEHCLLGTEDLLVFERSTDPKGMDQDLIFIYEPEGLAKSEENAQPASARDGLRRGEPSTFNVQRPVQR
jgi:hypothetical protein